MYEDYMQNYFGNGSNNSYQNTYEQNLNGYQYGNMNNPYQIGYQNSMCGFGNCQNRDFNVANYRYENIENYYPEIYNILYPMVKRACTNNSMPVTREVFDRIVEDVYSNIGSNGRMELNINLGNDVRSEEKDCEKNANEKEERSHGPNGLLRDLIGILVIRELLSRPGCCGPRPRPGMGFGMQNRYYF